LLEATGPPGRKRKKIAWEEGGKNDASLLKTALKTGASRGASYPFGEKSHGRRGENFFQKGRKKKRKPILPNGRILKKRTPRSTCTGRSPRERSGGCSSWEKERGIRKRRKGRETTPITLSTGNLRQKTGDETAEKQ